MIHSPAKSEASSEAGSSPPNPLRSECPSPLRVYVNIAYVTYMCTAPHCMIHVHVHYNFACSEAHPVSYTRYLYQHEFFRACLMPTPMVVLIPVAIAIVIPVSATIHPYPDLYAVGAFETFTSYATDSRLGSTHNVFRKRVPAECRQHAVGDKQV